MQYNGARATPLPWFGVDGTRSTGRLMLLVVGLAGLLCDLLASNCDGDGFSFQ